MPTTEEKLIAARQRDAAHLSALAALADEIRSQRDALLAIARDALVTFERRFPDSPTTADLRREIRRVEEFERQ